MSDALTQKIAEAALCHAYLLAIALTVGIVFGAAWAFIPLGLGLLLLLAA